MKRKLLLCAALFALTAFAYGQDFGSKGTQWYYNAYNEDYAPGNPDNIYMESVSDTLINGINTHKIIRIQYNQDGQAINLDPYYVVEQDNTVFLYDKKSSDFKTIFIFNASIGDTLTLDYPETFEGQDNVSYRLIIEGIEEVDCNLTGVKKYYTRALDGISFGNDGCFIDKIGGMSWFLPQASTSNDNERQISCFYSDQLSLNFQSSPCKTSLSTVDGDHIEIPDVIVYPNPTGGEISIYSSKTYSKSEIKDMNGNLIITFYDSNVNLDELTPGAYILTTYFVNGQIVSKTIVINAQ
ncbi:MAG: T9SS type A sorting domain-containing protein [Bacteroidales bacterium]|nr:T9SS type A sorting domain-containing protein [Bacteroidales bacterium]